MMLALSGTTVFAQATYATERLGGFFSSYTSCQRTRGEYLRYYTAVSACVSDGSGSWFFSYDDATHK
jgi:hypothetical protein